MSESLKAPATGPESPSKTKGGKSVHWRRWLLPVGTVVVGVLVVIFAVTAWRRLDSTGANSDWIPVYQDVLKTGFAALAVGALGGLAKLVFDQRKAREADATKLRDLRYRYITTLVELSYDIDTAKLVILANRSVKSWTDMVNERIVPARSRLGDTTHQLKNWVDAGLPVFDDTDVVIEELEATDRYLHSLLDEYGENKQALGELQRRAEDPRNAGEREQLLNQIWGRMSGLPFLGDFVKHGQKYKDYHDDNYLAALLKMRRSLVPKAAANRR